MLQHSRTSDISYKYFENKRIEDVQLINRRERREREKERERERERKREREETESVSMKERIRKSGGERK